MKMVTSKRKPLWARVLSGNVGDQFLQSANRRVMLSALNSGSTFPGGLRGFEGRSVLVEGTDQLATALTLLELDGVARRIVLCPPGLPGESLSSIVRDANIEIVVNDREGELQELPGLTHVQCQNTITKADIGRAAFHETEWVLFTSGTTGRPKMAVHTLASLSVAIKHRRPEDASNVWATFYDMRRYGGLQAFLRAMLGNYSFVLSSADETLDAHLDRLAAHDVTYVTGTPSHWRRVLMSASARKIAPRYVRLSGEIADQGVLDGLQRLYPKARIVHAYASTEAGVGFEVDDGREGFPASFIGSRCEGISLDVRDGSLCMRSAGTAMSYLPERSAKFIKENGFVDTGDLVELRGARYYFIGRKDGVINVGGQKVHPEEVEAVINRHPRVHMSRVSAKKNSILGAVLVADIIPKPEFVEGIQPLENEVRELCASQLDRHKVPAWFRFVESLPITQGGKLARHHA